jgi:protein-S-isoprenylcysteine O-methyltransferase Ste14
MQSFTTQIINLTSVIFVVYWIVAAFSTKRTLKGHRGGQWRLYVYIIALTLFMFGNQLGLRGGSVLLPYSPTSGIIADILAVCGLIIALWARATLGGNWSSNVVIKEDHELIERGPYAYVRHPIYSGVLLIVLAFALNSGRLAWFMVLVSSCLGLYIKARLEEKLLTSYFPEAYPKYMTKVKALVPFVV